MIILVLHEGFSVHITHYRVALPSQIPFFSTVQPPWWWCEREGREGSGTAGLSDASVREITPYQSHHTASHPGSHVSNTYLDHFLNSCQRHRLPTMQSLLVLLLLFFLLSDSSPLEFSFMWGSRCIPQAHQVWTCLCSLWFLIISIFLFFLISDIFGQNIISHLNV